MADKTVAPTYEHKELSHKVKRLYSLVTSNITCLV
jgi:hypothetical protein